MGNESISGTCEIAGGAARLEGTRVPVWVLEGYRRLGWSDDRILRNYPSVSASGLRNAWTYVDTHREEIEAALREDSR